MKTLAKFLSNKLIPPVRVPDRVYGSPDDPVPYLIRWHLIPKNKIFNIYLHHFVRGDMDHELHDHPWANVSFLLQGEYTEETQKGQKIYKAGALKFRGASFAHRVDLHDGPCWSLFMTGPRIRDWGFYHEDGWVAASEHRQHRGE